MITQYTVEQIRDAIISKWETKFSVNIPLLRGFMRKTATIMGMSFVTLQKYAGSILLCLFPQEAPDTEIVIGSTVINPLQHWGNLLGVEKKAGQRAERAVTVSVITQGGTLLSGTILVNAETNFPYQTVGDVSLSSATVTATIRALKVGVAGNIDHGTTLHFQNAPAAVEKEVTATGPTTTLGTDPETTEEYRERVLERFLAWPQGGAMADYKLWGEEVVGVLNVYPYAGFSGDARFPDGKAGQVFIIVESAVNADGIADAGLLAEVFEHIERNELGLASRRNINAEVRCFSIDRLSFSVRFFGLQGGFDSTSTVRDAIVDAVTQYMLERQPGGQEGYTILGPRKDIVNAVEVAAVASKVAAGYGGTVESANVYLNSNLTSLYFLQEGEKAKLGSVTWV